jgi:general secretion pathway protein J
MSADKRCCQSQSALHTARIARSVQGFTLIEVLIAMTLLSVMMAMLFGTMKICADSWEKGESKITDVNEVAVVYNFFQRHLSTALPLWDDFSSDPNSGIRLFSFQGRADGLQFVSHFPASAGKPGAQAINLQLAQDDGDGQVINVALTPFFPLAAGGDWEKEEVVLLKHVKHFELHYFGADDQNGGEPYWQDQWLEKEFQPRLIKIKIELDNGIFWPEMIIDLKATISAESIGLSTDAAITDNTGQAGSE